MASSIYLILFFLLLSPTLAHSTFTPVPAQKEELRSWFDKNVGPFETRKSTLDPALFRAESSPITITVRADGSGHFRTIRDAINSIPKHNVNRVIISIGPGIYREKISVKEPFVTLLGDPQDIPTLIFDGTKAQFNGTRKSATLSVEMGAEYFMGVNLIIKNTAPKPLVKDGGQAVALKVKGKKTAFYNCKFSGFQDTLCTDGWLQFYQNCYVVGAVDFIFGQGKSIFMETHIKVLPNKNGAFITEQESSTPTKVGGFSFLHCTVSGIGENAYLGRAMHPYATTVFSYSDIGDIVKPEGWFTEPNFDDRNTFFEEYKNIGIGSRLEMRKHNKNLSDSEVAKFLTFDYINASQWLLQPPPHRR